MQCAQQWRVVGGEEYRRAHDEVDVVLGRPSLRESDTVLETPRKTLEFVRRPDEVEGFGHDEARVGGVNSSKRRSDTPRYGRHPCPSRKAHFAISQSTMRAQEGEHAVEAIRDVAVLAEGSPQTSSGGVHSRQRFVIGDPAFGQIAFKKSVGELATANCAQSFIVG
jgi:hypothetical protein